jgi:hypothetical protein
VHYSATLTLIICHVARIYIYADKLQDLEAAGVDVIQTEGILAILLLILILHIYHIDMYHMNQLR